MSEATPPKIGDIVWFFDEFDPFNRQREARNALVLGYDQLRLTLAFVDTIFENESHEVGRLVILSDVRFEDDVRDSVDGSVLAAHWVYPVDDKN